jgi:DNA-binding MarR family transcriptional regulator
MSDFAVERARRIFQARQPTRERPQPAHAPAAPELGEFVGALHVLHSRLRRLDGFLRREHQLNLTEMRVLSAVPAAPPALRPVGRGNAAARLAREVELSPSGLTRLVDRLVERGLLTRVTDAWDKRVTHLVLTERGLAVRDAVVPHVTEMLRDSCGGELWDQVRVLVAAMPAERSARRR